MTPPTTPRRSGPSGASASTTTKTPTTPSTPAFTISQDMEDPTSTPSSYIRSSNPSSSSAPHNTTAADDSGDEDEAPDYLRLLSSLHPKSKSSCTPATSGIVIPKRGEKDFEPTGFGGQSKLLDRSRQAMFTAVSGQRTVGSRSLVRAVWNPKLRRASLLDVQGKIFETVGVIRRESVVGEGGKMMTKAVNELLPEEALFLAERGSLQLYTAAEGKEGEGEGKGEGELVPMSLQQAFALLMLPATQGKGEGGIDEPLTREAYLIYAYLKRLGYVVQRATVVDAVRATPVSAGALARKNLSHSSNTDMKAEAVIADPERPLKLVTIWDVLFYIPRRIAQLGGDAAQVVARWVQWIWRKTIARFVAIMAARVRRRRGGAGASLGLGLGLAIAAAGGQDGRRFLGDKGNVKWDTYDAVFSSLQIVPSGHDFLLPSSSSSSSSTIQLPPNPHPKSETEKALQPFYYAYRPATLYRKSHPPPPEFRIVILNARTHPLPSIWGFESIFAQIPIPGSDQELFSASSSPSLTSSCSGEAGMSAEEVKERVEYEKALKASNEAKNRAAYGKFSEGKQKFLRDKTAARQAAVAERKQKQAENEGRWKRFWTSSVGRVLVKMLLMDFAWLRVIARVFRHSPGCWISRSQNRGGSGFKPKKAGAGGRGGGTNVFPPLKAGRRSVVVAVVDGSITTLLRFGESEFAHWALYGSQPRAQPQPQSHTQAHGQKTVESSTADAS